MAYSGDSDPETRLTVESQLLDNDVKVVAATSALGMGFDKPDLAFVIHYQSPGSPIAYYQQVGRAGRQLDTSHGVLLRGAEDEDIQDFFIRRAFPPQVAAEAVVAHLDTVDDFVRIQDLEAVVNLPRTRIETMMKQLEVDEAIESNGLKYRRTPTPWQYDTERVDGVTAQRRSEQEQMRTYATSDGCRMAFLENLLDDPEPVACGVCDNCAPVPAVALDPELVRAAVEFLRNRPLVISPRKRTAENTAIPKDEYLEEGRALAKWADSGWGTLVRRRQARRSPLRRPTRRRRRQVGRRLATRTRTDLDHLRALAPSARHSSPTSRERLGDTLGLPVVAAITQVRATEHQMTMHNSAQQSRNVAGAFEVADGLRRGAGTAGGRHRRLAMDAHRGRRSAAPGRLSGGPPARPRRLRRFMTTGVITQPRGSECHTRPRENKANCGSLAAGCAHRYDHLDGDAGGGQVAAPHP